LGIFAVKILKGTLGGLFVCGNPICSHFC